MALKEKTTWVHYWKSFWSRALIMLYQRLFHKIQHTLLTLWQLFLQWRKFQKRLKVLHELIKVLPSGYERVDIVADTHQENSIKSIERKDRGKQVKYLLNQQSQKFHRTLVVFYQTMITKKEMIEPIFDWIDFWNNYKRKFKVLNLTSVHLLEILKF